MLKRCFKCGDEKPRDAFYAHPQMADGLLGKCRDCAKKDVRSHRLQNADSVREYDRARSKAPHRVADRARRFREYVEAHPERRAAHVAVNNAVRAGKLAKTPCAFCGAEGRLEAHHHDYAKPLDVTWLCKPCHSRFHALEQMATYRDEEAA